MIMDGHVGAWRVQGGMAYLYAVMLADGKPAGRQLLYRTVPDGGMIADMEPVRHDGQLWGCVIRLSAGAKLLPAPDDVMQASGDFAAFLDTENARRAAEEAAQFAHQRMADHNAMETAYQRLSDVNRRIGAWEDDRIYEGDALTSACHVLGQYLGVEIQIPPSGIHSDGPQIAEILRHSGIRYKAVQLAEDWWKKDSGAMLGMLTDGTPVTLLPRGMRGYRVYNPRTNDTERVSAKNAHLIQRTATAVYRTFPAEPMGMRKILRFILGEHVYLEIGIILLFSFLAAIVQILPPILSGYIFDIIVPDYARGLLVEVILILLAFSVAGIGFAILVNLGFARVKNKIELSVQAGIWDRLMSLRLPFFHQFTSGELLEKIKAISKVKDALSLDLLKTFLSALFSFVNIIVMFRYSAAITPYVLLMFLICFLLTAYAGYRMNALNKRYVALNGRASTLRQQLVDGIERIKASRAEERAWGIWGAYESELRYLKGRMKRLDSILDAFYSFFRLASVAVVYFLVSRQPDIGMGVFVAYISTFMILQAAMMDLMKVVRIVPELLPVMQDIGPILAATPEQTVGRKTPRDLDGSLSIDHVAFRYDAYGQQVLRDVSLHVAPGESIGILGASGSGKSTLLGLILGLYPPTSGKLYVGGCDLDTVDMEMLRKQIGVVMQRGALSVGDIYGSLAGDHPGFTEADAYATLEVVGMAEVVRRLPEGIYTALEQCGGHLSEGQMQLLMIARAIAGEPQYILFDEATSSLDNLMQAKVMAALHKLPATKIVIAQRFASVRHCDRILFMRDGAFTRETTYDQILAWMAENANNA